MTSHIHGVEMTDGELSEFLHEQGTGVLALAGNGVAYAVPVSIGYDGEGERCLLDLGFGPQSKKREFIEATDTACLTVYDRRSVTDWRSVVLTGTLRRLTGDVEAGDEDVLDAASLFHTYAKTATASRFDEPLQGIDFEWYELRIEERSGRRGPRLRQQQVSAVDTEPAE